MKTKWTSVFSIIEQIEEGHANVRSGRTSAPAARAEARYFTAALGMLKVAVDHARVSGRIRKGQSAIPDVGIGKKKAK